MRLHGHGLRERQVLGPLALGDTAGEYSVFIRRYRCRECGVVVQVGPSDLLGRQRYGLVAIVLALVVWGLDGQSSWQVRQRVSPQQVFGHGTCGRWPILRRWVRRFARSAAIPSDSSGPRRQASALTRWWAAHAPATETTASLLHRALCGARLITAGDH